MPANLFLDTNTIIYLYSKSEPGKAQLIRDLIRTNYCVTSLQVFSEACNVWIKKLAWDSNKIFEHLNNIALICDAVLPISRNTIDTALNLQSSYSYAYYDCLILAAALEGGCDTVLSEDMQDGQVIDGKYRSLVIKSPFR